ncbi:MAG: hypothetical protein PHI63_01875 [Patescibacteria group bacterium]|nr:hypothetical protein [Patescibacteria group bacterium]
MPLLSSVDQKSSIEVATRVDVGRVVTLAVFALTSVVTAVAVIGAVIEAVSYIIEAFGR